MTPLPTCLSWERRNCFPSMATMPATSSATACTQLRKPWLNCSLSSMAKVSPKVSWDGMPLAKLRYWLNHACWALPKASMATQLSAPQRTPQTVMKIMLRRGWPTLPGWRGSLTSPKCSFRVATTSRLMGSFLFPLIISPFSALPPVVFT